MIKAKGWTPAGLMAAMSNRDKVDDCNGFPARTDRAAKNMLENMVLFTALVAAASLGGVADPHVEIGARIFYWARVAYIPIYMIGIPVARHGRVGDQRDRHGDDLREHRPGPALRAQRRFIRQIAVLSTVAKPTHATSGTPAAAAGLVDRPRRGDIGRRGGGDRGRADGRRAQVVAAEEQLRTSP